MPIYEYQCENCGERFSVVVSWLKRNQVQCPKCGGNNIKQLISSFGAMPGHNCSSTGSRRFK